MNRVQLDDTFPENPKVRQVGPQGLALYLSGLCYCSRQMTDGFIPLSELAILAEMVGAKPPQRVAEALTKARLWKKVRGGFRVPDYLSYNTSKAEIEQKRAANRQRQAEWRAAQRNGVTDAVTNSVSNDPQLGSYKLLEKSSYKDQLTDYPELADLLGTERYFVFRKLLSHVRGGDDGTPRVLASLCKKLPAAKIDQVRTSYRSGAPVGKIVNALKQKAREYEAEVKAGQRAASA